MGGIQCFSWGTVVIDNYYRNRKLTNLFETRVGGGNLVFSSIDLISNLDERIEARQLRHSLVPYMKSDLFDPEKRVSLQSIRESFEVTEGLWKYPSARF
jgi:hypothetical protein